MFTIKKLIIILTIVLFSISYAIVYFYRNENSLDINVNNRSNISVTYDEKIINCTQTIDNDNLHIDISPINAGKTNIAIEGDTTNKNGEIVKYNTDINVYVHKTGIVTLYNYLGKCKGDFSFTISFYIIVFIIIIYLIKKYRNSIKNNLYSYNNARILGLIVFICVNLLYHVFIFTYDFIHGYHNNSFYALIDSIQANISIILMLMVPFASILTLLVLITSFKLIKNEGKTWRNMLGVILGSFICLSTIIVVFMQAVSYNINGNILQDCFYYVLFMFISYLESVLLGTCILGIKAARKIPSFDKDAIIILGCKIRKDGTLTNLLKSRVDRAIEFSKMQKAETGKDIIFVPSGGKGQDEVIAEAQAMKNYLIEHGIKEESILLEDNSKNTYENIKFSNKIINEKIENAKIAFSTTNYHVFRAGIIANEQNIEIEGIGSKTKMYYWINAFIREFIATLVSEKKKHIKTLIILMSIVIFLTLVRFLAIVI